MIGAIMVTTIKGLLNIFKKKGTDRCEHKYKITKIQITKSKNSIQEEECEKCGKKRVQYL